ncbi:Fic family protein [Companilactobacillus keshanensis]|uniref:Fic family protein n=1 Tax=Companilactobacillus keshanensis TaxID=2486003 RepID=A0ABW4BVE4_9LACO|nr:Fic family protein [Companilactobacillus keshanensis]
MKDFKILYKKVRYQGVIYWTYQSEKEIKDLLYILQRQMHRQYKNLSDKKLTVSSEPVDNEHGEIIVELDGKVLKKYLIMGIETIYLNMDDMIEYNEAAQDIFKEDGVYGKRGVTDSSTLDYTVSSVRDSFCFDLDTSPSIAHKAAKYWYRTAYYQAFSNGNKRTGLIAALMFLYLNFYIFDNGQDKSDLYEKISIRIANGRCSEYDVYMFIIDNVSYDIERTTKNFIMRGKSK